MLGFNWFLDKELSITNLPPSPSAQDLINTSSYARLQQDVIRFIYQREKIRLSCEISGVYAQKALNFLSICPMCSGTPPLPMSVKCPIRITDYRIITLLYTVKKVTQSHL